MTVTIDLADPATFASGAPHDALAELRATDPVHHQEMEGEAGFWAVLRHADVVHVARNPELFSASAGGVVVEDLADDQLEMMRHMLLAMDPPVHTAHRHPISDHFRAKVIARSEDRIRAICRDILTTADRDASSTFEVEFVHDVCGPVPSRVIGELMGLPSEDLPRLHLLAERATSGQDPDVDPAAGRDSAQDSAQDSASVEIAMYGIEMAARRRSEPPREDLTSVILGSSFDGRPMDDIDFGSFFAQLVIAGNDTTTTMLSSGLKALLDHPDQLALVRGDPALLPDAVEEILRYANPLHYFRRTATVDTVIGDTPVRAGDKVAMYYTSANRDEAVFADPQRFDVTRHPNPHLSFGIAAHFCLGVHLARLMGRVFFEELFARYPVIEQSGPDVHIRSNLNNGLRRFPVRLSRA